MRTKTTAPKAIPIYSPMLSEEGDGLGVDDDGFSSPVVGGPLIGAAVGADSTSTVTLAIVAFASNVRRDDTEVSVEF